MKNLTTLSNKEYSLEIDNIFKLTAGIRTFRLWKAAERSGSTVDWTGTSRSEMKEGMKDPLYHQIDLDKFKSCLITEVEQEKAGVIYRLDVMVQSLSK